MRKTLNCPNCGAVINAPVCPYCGSVFYDFANIEPCKPSYLRMKLGDNLYIFKANVSSIDIHSYSDESTFYADDVPITCCFNPHYSVDIHMDIISDDRGVLLEKYSKGVI